MNAEFRIGAVRMNATQRKAWNAAKEAHRRANLATTLVDRRLAYEEAATLYDQAGASFMARQCRILA